MKSLNIDIIFPWEIGLLISILGLLLIFFGIRQSKKGFYHDINKIPFIKPTTKIFFGSVAMIFGGIQLLPLFTIISEI